jgi:glutamyl-tRNA synthetase
MRAKSDAELLAAIRPFLVESGLLKGEATAADGLALAAIPLVKERLHFLADAPAMMRYLFEEPALAPREDFIPKKLDSGRAAELLAAAAALLPSCELSSIPDCEAKFRAEAERLGAKFGDLMMPVRVAVTGARVSPPLFESIALLGLDKSLARIEAARKLLASA